MKKNLLDIDKLFQSSIDEHTESVPPGVWKNIESDLDKTQAVSFEKKYYRLRRLAIALLLFGFIGGVYALYTNMRKTKPGKDANKTITKIHSTNRPSKFEPVNKNEKNKLSQKNPDRTEETVISTKTEKDLQHSESSEKNYTVPPQKLKKEINLPKEPTISTKQTVAIQQKNILKNKLNKFIKKESINIVLSKPVKNDIENILTNTSSQITQHIFSPLPLVEKEDHLIGSSFMNKIAGRSIVKTNSITQEINSVANSPKQKTKSLHRLFLTAFASPDFSSEHFKDDSRFAGPGRNRDDAKKNEQQFTAFSTGLLIDYTINPKWNLQSGVSLSSSVTAIAPKIIYARADNNGNVHYEFHCSSGYSYLSKSGSPPSPGDSIQVLGSKSKLQYAAIPLLLKYNVTKGKFNFSPSAGVSANFLTKGKVETIIGSTNESSTNDITGLRPVYLNGLVSFDAEYKLNDIFSVGISPGGRFALTSINKHTPVKSYQNYFSIAAVIKIRL